MEQGFHCICNVLFYVSSKLYFTLYQFGQFITTAGLVEIEKIKAGDIVISTNPDTLETAEKSVLETYIRQVDKLVHLTINGEEIVTTVDHPFYVQGRGFIQVRNLFVGDNLLVLMVTT